MEAMRLSMKTSANGNLLGNYKLNNMKKFIWSAIAAIVAISACQVEEPYNGGLAYGDDVFYASIQDEGSSKTVLDADNNIRWSAGDQLVIFSQNSLGLRYQIQDSYVGKNFGYFSKVTSGSTSDEYGAGMSIMHHVAYYPYSSDVYLEKSGSDYKLQVSLPSDQPYAPESFGKGAFPMAAVSEDTDLTFRNVCGGIMLQLTGTCKVASIQVEGNKNEKLAGDAVVTVYSDNAAPSIAMAADAMTSVTLDCGDGVQLNEATATEFIISLPPTTFTGGFTITVTDTDGGTQTIETSKENVVKRTSLLKMPEVAVQTGAPGLDLSAKGTANSYIVSEAGSYKFTPTKGNSGESVGDIASVEVLWETFGTDTAPDVGDLIATVKYENGVVSFATPSTFKEGNAVIAAKDASGTILWSWHIWMTDEPEGQVYFNDAGTVMDRNLGATSATPGDVGTLGLLYQWGRKDPFPGSSAIHYDDMERAKSTIVWPESVKSTSTTGTLSYATANPTTFITYGYNNSDWLYDGSSSIYATRWQPVKTSYDPCPVGWVIPDCGEKGPWAKALGFCAEYPYVYDLNLEGMNFSGDLGTSSVIWYPASGGCRADDGSFDFVGEYGYYWAAGHAQSYGYYGYYNYFYSMGCIFPSSDHYPAYGFAVRCVKE